MHRRACNWVVSAAFALGIAALLAAGPAGALDDLDFRVTGATEALEDDLRSASLLIAATSGDETDAQDLFTVARAEYGRLLGALYARGYYSGVIAIRIDGREAASIAPLDAPTAIRRIEVSVDTGPAFLFSTARIAPIAPDTEVPDGFRTGEPAESGLVQDAVNAGIDGWRAVGHAKADTGSETVVADHARRTLAADIALNPGPRLRFGPLFITGQVRMREKRIRDIAGLPEGTVYDPEVLARSADRLRRIGVFKSVSLVEDEQVTAPDLLGITATVVEEKTRRYTFGAEVASIDGLSVTAAWLHRNLRGGAERLRIYGEVAQIGAQTSGMDYSLGFTLDRPATITPDTTLGLRAEIGRQDEDDYLADYVTFGLTATQIVSDRLTFRAALEYEYSEGRDDLSDFTYQNLSLPLGGTWDRRDVKTDPTRGTYLDAEVRPFLGFDTTGSGVRIEVDGRAFQGFGAENHVILAGRVQGGVVLGSDLLETPRDYLFYSGGGGSVRGQAYQSLGVEVPGPSGPVKIGGTHYVGFSAEVRTRVTDRIGIVGFVDAGQVGNGGFAGNDSDWHAGAGLGLRYATGFGPIRLDVAAPVGGASDEGSGVQLYVGIGQSF